MLGAKNNSSQINYLCIVPHKKNKHKDIQDTVKKDSIPLIISPAKDTTTAPSLFKGHLLPVKNIRPQLHVTKYDYLVTGILLFLFILFVWLYVSNRKKLNQIIKGFYQTRFTNENARDEFSFGNRVSVFLSVFFVITLTIFITRILSYYHIQLFKSNAVELIIAFLIIAIYSVKFAVINLIGYVFQVQKEARDYMMSVFLFCNALGLFMFPIVICLTFIKQVSPLIFIYAGIGIVISFICVRMIRGLFIGLKSPRVSRFYLFMYLCTLEILPFILLVKFFILKIK